MYSGVDCYWIETTARMKLSLRRFTFSDRGRDCPREPKWGHNAVVELEDEIERRTQILPDGWEILDEVPKEHRPARDDPRWPTVCAHCEEPFQDKDEWQVNQAEIYLRKETGEELAFRGYADKRMAGALFDCWWLHGRRTKIKDVEYRYVGEDGIALVGVCPNGASWEIDGPASSGGKWARTGDPRDPKTLTVTPSIVAGDYHGFLTNGFFTDG